MIAARATLAELLRFVGGNAHILREYPELFFQQAANQPDSSAPCILAERRWQAAIETRPWLRLRNKPQHADPCLLTIGGSGAPLAGCAFSGDGAEFWAVLRDGTLTRWELPSGAEAAHTRTVASDLLGCVFAPDGEQFMAYSPGRGIGLFDARTGEALPGGSPEAVPHFSPDAFAWSHAARTLVSGHSGGKLELWDTTTGARLVEARMHQADVFACAMSRDGRWIASGSGRWNENAGQLGGWGVGGYDRGELGIWDTTGNELRAYSAHRNLISACAFAPDGTWLASGSRDGSLALWEVRTGTAVELPGHPGASLSACAFSPDGGRLVTASNDQTLKLWEVASRTELATLTGHSDAVSCCAFSSDGTWLLSGARNGELKLWDVARIEAAGSATSRLPPVRTVAYSPDGGELLCATLGQTLDWLDAERAALTGRERLQGVAVASGYSPDGAQRSAAFWNLIELWDTKSGEWLVAFQESERLHRSPLEDLRARGWPEWLGTPLVPNVNFVQACAYAPDGRRLAIAWQDGTLRLWDPRSFEPLATLHGHTAAVRACSFSPDGRQLISASDDRSVRLWDAEQGTLLASLTGHRGEVTDCAWSADGRRIVSVSEDGTLRIWDALHRTGVAVVRGQAPFGLCPEGRRLVATLDDDVLLVSELATGSELFRAFGHHGPIRQCGFSPDAQWIVSCAEDGTLRLWEAETGLAQVTYAAGSGINAFAMRSDGRIALGPATGGLLLLDLEGLAPRFPVVPPRLPELAGAVLPPRHAGRKGALTQGVIGSVLILLGVLAGRWSPWLWIIGAPLALLGGAMLLVGLLQLSGLAVPVSCPRCHGNAVRWRGRELVCGKCGRWRLDS